MPKQLLMGESMVVPPIRKHWIVMAKWVFWPSVLTVVPLAIINLVFDDGPAGQAIVLLTLLALVVLGGGWWLAWANWQASVMTVTDQRVIVEEGIIVRTSKVIPLDRVQDVSSKQNVFGRLLDYGNVEIESAGTTPELFTYVAHPALLLEQVFVLSEQLRRGL
jgi:uncharacterized membrane protein YdbT with pleckstrin-like domain